MPECGTVKLVYMGYLAETAGGREQEVEICGEARISEIARLPRDELEELVILVNGHAAKPDTTVKPGDKITILPHISGG